MTFCSLSLVLSALVTPDATAQDHRSYPYPLPGISVDSPSDTGLGLVMRRGNRDHLATDMGVGVLVGGGSMVRLSDREINPTTPGGAWHVRTVIGTRSFVATEFAYLGSATPVLPGVAGRDDVLLMSNGGEVGLRAQVPVAVGIREDLVVAPFASAGLGLQVQDLINEQLEVLGDRMIGNDLTVHIPVGAGLSLASQGFIAEARVAYRPAVMNDRRVFGTPSAFDNAIDELSVGGSIGVEF